MRPTLRSQLSALGFLLTAAAALAQGSLTPPGAPAPTMKTLDQLSTQLTAADAKQESRVAIETLPGDATAKFLITQPGSYYLRGNLSVAAAAQSAIRVSATNVTIDLNGFSVRGPGPAPSTVAAIVSSENATVVRNGSITGWKTGVSLATNGAAVDLVINEIGAVGVSLTGQAGIARNVMVNGAGDVGILAALVDSCTVQTVAGGHTHKFGIDGAVVRGCIVNVVTAQGSSIDAHGIRGRVIQGCRVNNIGSERQAYGVRTVETDSGSITDCAATDVSGADTTYGLRGGTVANSSAQNIVSTGSNAYGIGGSVVEQSSAADVTNGNTAFAVAVGIDAEVVRGCRVKNVNTVDQNAHGIIAIRVSDCHVSYIQASPSLGQGTGIFLEPFGLAQGNSIYVCRTTGIRVSSNSVVLHNNTAQIGTATGVTDAANISVVGFDNRIEGNSMNGGTGSDYGLRVTNSRNLVVSNRASSTFTGAATGAGGVDTPEYNLIAGNRFGSIVSAFAASGEILASNPFANFAD